MGPGCLTGPGPGRGPERNEMRLEYIIRLLAGTLVLASIILGYFVSTAWLFLGLFVGLNLIQSSFTGFCPAEKVISRIHR